MKIFLFAALYLLSAVSGSSQTLKKYPISNSGCSLYCYCPSKYEVAYSEDSSKVYTGECVMGDVTFGVICIKLLNPISDLSAAEELMISYVDFLKGSFEIQKANGYGKALRLNNNEMTRGILDYWEDKDLDKWKIKAWTDGNFIGFMFAYSKKDLPEQKVNVFLDSFRLPGM
ncbi:MAG: hypothetical protein SGI83_12045 [Bacteroidota bacterium]|nr:hypothetical protein [Bacteroidota bacterium]